jgi:hypothetical protein
VEYSYNYEVSQLWIPLDALNEITSDPKRLGEGGGGVVSTLSFQGDKKEWKYVRTASSIVILIVGTGFP